MNNERLHLIDLVDCIETGFQNLLTHLKQNFAQNVNDEDFFKCAKIYKDLTKQQKKTVDSRDFTLWDITLIFVWLRQFEWDPALTQDVKDRIKSLKDIRNAVSHKNIKTYDEEYFNCVKEHLRVLGVLSPGLEHEIDEVKNYLILHKDTLESIWPYTTNRVIGGGSFGVVLEAESKIGKDTSAVKLILENELKNNASREAENLVKCNHRNVVKHICAGRFVFTAENLKHVLHWDTEADGNKLEEETKVIIRNAFQKASENKKSKDTISGLYLAMKLCGDNLKNWLDYCLQVQQDQDKNFNKNTLQRTRQRISSELIDGLNYIHDQGIIHRDLRPPNIFFYKSKFVEPIKIGDFGLSKNVEKYVTQPATRKAVAHEYCGPEIHDTDNDGNIKYSQAFDYFALGLIISEIFDPVKTFHLNKRKDQLSQGELGPNLKEDNFFKLLVKKLMSKVPGDRYFTIGKTRTPLPRIMNASIEKTISCVSGEEVGNEMNDSIENTAFSGTGEQIGKEVQEPLRQMVIKITEILTEDYSAVERRRQIYHSLKLKSGADFYKLELDAGNDAWIFFHGMLQQYFSSHGDPREALKGIVSRLTELNLLFCANKVEKLDSTSLGQ